MKRLGLLRHAKSDWDDMALRDFDRGLNARGRRGAALMGAHIAAFLETSGPGFGLILASPAERVRRTLAASGLSQPVQYCDDAYLADSTTLLSILHGLPDALAGVLLVGHNPGLHDLALELMAPAPEGGGDHHLALNAKFPTAAFALFELPIGRWADLALGSGQLVHFARPRDLDPSLGPEHGH